MSPALTALVVVLSVLVGVTLGMLGGGGSIVTTPLLVYVAGAEPKAAIAESLVVVGITSAAALIGHARAGRVVWRIALAFGAGGIFGALIGGRAASLLSGRSSMLLFAAAMLASAVGMARRRKADEAARAPAPIWQLGAVGLAVGAFTGLVGAGGGFLIVPALTILGGLTMPEAVGTSLVVIALNSAAGFVGHASHVTIDVRLTATVTIAAIVGALVGSRLVDRVRPADLRRGFAVFVFVLAVLVFVQNW